MRGDKSGFSFSVYLVPFVRNLPVKLRSDIRQIPVKIKTTKRARTNGQNPLDTVLEKRPRGRPVKIKASWVRGRADNYRWVLNQVWDRVGPRLLKAQTHEDVILSYEGADIGSYSLEFVQLADLIIQVLKEKKFPKQNRKAQINFLADSIAAHGSVTPRSSRDICERERARLEHVYRILRYEFWIECSCGYKGRSFGHACPKCEAEIPFRADLGKDRVSF